MTVLVAQLNSLSLMKLYLKLVESFISEQVNNKPLKFMMTDFCDLKEKQHTATDCV